MNDNVGLAVCFMAAPNVIGTSVCLVVRALSNLSRFEHRLREPTQEPSPCLFTIYPKTPYLFTNHCRLSLDYRYRLGLQYPKHYAFG